MTGYVGGERRAGGRRGDSRGAQGVSGGALQTEVVLGCIRIGPRSKRMRAEWVMRAERCMHLRVLSRDSTGGCHTPVAPPPLPRKKGLPRRRRHLLLSFSHPVSLARVCASRQERAEGLEVAFEGSAGGGSAVVPLQRMGVQGGGVSLAPLSLSPPMPFPTKHLVRLICRPASIQSGLQRRHVAGLGCCYYRPRRRSGVVVAHS